MKLSEAILLGGTFGYQVTGALTDFRGGTCALGGAALAIGIDVEQHEADIYDEAGIYAALRSAFPTLAIPPAWLLDNEEHWDDRIITLNDDFAFSREQIAEYIVNHGLDCDLINRAGSAIGESIAIEGEAAGGLMRRKV